MKAFRFSLQRVLDVKTLLEDQQQQALAAARAETEAVAAMLDEARATRTAAMREDAEGLVHPWLRDMAWRRRERLLGRVRQLSAELVEARQREEAERKLLVQRHKERRVLERLSEKQRLQFDLEQARREQAMLDEAAATRRKRPLVGGIDEQT